MNLVSLAKLYTKHLWYNIWTFQSGIRYISSQWHAWTMLCSQRLWTMLVSTLFSLSHQYCHNFLTSWNKHIYVNNFVHACSKNTTLQTTLLLHHFWNGETMLNSIVGSTMLSTHNNNVVQALFRWQPWNNLWDSDVCTCTWNLVNISVILSF